MLQFCVPPPTSDPSLYPQHRTPSVGPPKFRTFFLFSPDPLFCFLFWKNFGLQHWKTFATRIWALWLSCETPDRLHLDSPPDRPIPIHLIFCVTQILVVVTQILVGDQWVWRPAVVWAKSGKTLSWPKWSPLRAIWRVQNRDKSRQATLHIEGRIVMFLPWICRSLFWSVAHSARFFCRISFVCRIAALSRVWPVAVTLSLSCGNLAANSSCCDSRNYDAAIGFGTEEETSPPASHLRVECTQESDHGPERVGSTPTRQRRRGCHRQIWIVGRCLGFPCSHLLTLNLCLLGEVFDAVGSEIEAGRNLSSLLLLGCVALRRVSNEHCRGNSVNASLSLLSRFVWQLVRECRDDSCLCSLVVSSPLSQVCCSSSSWPDSWLCLPVSSCNQETNRNKTKIQPGLVAHNPPTWSADALHGWGFIFRLDVINNNVHTWTYLGRGFSISQTPTQPVVRKSAPTPERGLDISVSRKGEEGKQTRLWSVSLTKQARHKKNTSSTVNFVFSETTEKSGTIQHMQHVSQNSKHWLNLFLSHAVLDLSGITICHFIADRSDPWCDSLLHPLPFVADFFKPTNSHVRPRSSPSRSQIWTSETLQSGKWIFCQTATVLANGSPLCAKTVLRHNHGPLNPSDPGNLSTANVNPPERHGHFCNLETHCIGSLPRILPMIPFDNLHNRRSHESSLATRTTLRTLDQWESCLSRHGSCPNKTWFLHTNSTNENPDNQCDGCPKSSDLVTRWMSKSWQTTTFGSCVLAILSKRGLAQTLFHTLILPPWILVIGTNSNCGRNQTGQCRKIFLKIKTFRTWKNRILGFKIQGSKLSGLGCVGGSRSGVQEIWMKLLSDDNVIGWNFGRRKRKRWNNHRFFWNGLGRKCHKMKIPLDMFQSIHAHPRSNNNKTCPTRENSRNDGHENGINQRAHRGNAWRRCRRRTSRKYGCNVVSRLFGVTDNTATALPPPTNAHVLGCSWRDPSYNSSQLKSPLIGKCLASINTTLCQIVTGSHFQSSLSNV